MNAVLGDPCRQFILEEAGIRNYDVILALGREDTDNFEICQMGRKVLGIKPLDDFKKTVSDYLAWEVSNILKNQNTEDERLGK